MVLHTPCTALAAVMLVLSRAALGEPYSITGGGAQFQIGGEIPLPLQAASAGATTAMFPALLVPVNPNPGSALVEQTAGPDPKKMRIPPGVLRRAPGANDLVIAQSHPVFLQVRTRLEFSAPDPALGSAVLSAGGRTGLATQTFFPPSGHGGLIVYQKTAAQFGGPLRAAIEAIEPIRKWRLAPGATAPCKHPTFPGGLDATCIATLVSSAPTIAVIGAPLGATATTPGGPAMTPNRVFASVDASGRVVQSASAAPIGTLTDMATSWGGPWTTGRVFVVQSTARGGAEDFTITGMDSRVNGSGTISLVSGSLSNRALSGPNANRGWLRFTLPEPDATLSTAAALAMLAVAHAVVGRRGRPGPD